MAFFTLTDIKFKPTKPTQSNKKNNFEGMDIKRYPEDIGTASGRGHYIQFFIKTQSKVQNVSDTTAPLGTAASTAQAGMQLGTDIKGIFNNVIANSPKLSEPLGNLETKAQDFLNKHSGVKNAFNIMKNTTNQALKNLSQGLRKTTRTNAAIALYMPDNLLFNYAHGFNDVDSREILGRNVTAGIQLTASVVDTLKKGGNISNVLSNISPFFGEKISDLYAKFGSQSSAAGFFNALTGTVQNPQVELLYYNTKLREFSFDFQFTPRSQKEAQEVLEIIRLFKYHAAPQILPNSSGRFLIPPSEFDIKFYYNGVENLNIPKIGNCVLQSVNINYAPNGFSTYELAQSPDVSYGGTGMPVAIRMSLSFHETEIITKDLLGIPGSEY